MTGQPPQMQQGPPQQQGQQQQTQPLPPTGLEQQLASINKMRMGAQSMGALPQQAMSSALPQQQQPAKTRGSTSLNDLASSLAKSYGLQLGRGDLVDEQGNFLMTPDQLAAASGGSESMGSAAAKMNYIADAIQRRQQEQQAKKSEAALQTGLGLVQSRGRGSLAAMQSGFYEGLANLYQGQQYEAADFSYFIQKEQFDIQQNILSRAEKLAKKQARGQFLTGIGAGIAGVFSGNFALAAGGFASAGGSAGSTGWFAVKEDKICSGGEICG